MKTPMTNKSGRLTPQSLHSTLTIQLTFLRHFFIFFISYATPRLVPQTTGTRHTKAPPARWRARRPYNTQKTAAIGEQLKLLPPFLGNPGGEQPGPLPTVKTGELIIASQVGTQLFKEDLP